MKTKEEMQKKLDEIVARVSNDPAAQREIARMKQSEGGFLHQLSERSIRAHQAKIQAEARAERARRAAGAAAEPARKVARG